MRSITISTGSQKYANMALGEFTTAISQPQFHNHNYTTDKFTTGQFHNWQIHNWQFHNRQFHNRQFHNRQIHNQMSHSMYVLYCVWSLKIIKILIENPGFFFSKIYKLVL